MAETVEFELVSPERLLLSERFHNGISHCVLAAD